jgi:hypothetical protein
MAHAFCGSEDRSIKCPGHFQKLPKETTNYLTGYLIDAQSDYEVDCFLATRFPELLLEYNYSYSNALSQQDIKRKLAQIPLWEHRLEITVYLVEYYRNLLVLEHLPKSIHSNRQFKKAKRHFETLFKTCRLWLEDKMQKSLPSPQELITESDFKNCYDLMQWFCKTVELDTKQPNLR